MSDYRGAVSWSVNTYLTYIRAFFVLVGLVAFFLVASGIYLLVLVNQNETGSAKTFGNLCGSVTLISGVLFAIMAWYGFKRSLHLQPFIEHVVRGMSNHVTHKQIEYIIDDAGRETDREEVAQGIHDTAQNGAHPGTTHKIVRVLAGNPKAPSVQPRINHMSTAVATMEDVSDGEDFL